MIQTEAQSNKNKVLNQTLVEDNETNMQVGSKDSEKNETKFQNETEQTSEGQSSEVTLRKSDSNESLD